MGRKVFPNITDDVCKNVSTLSGGNQAKKNCLSKWLSTDLDVLILNGPTVGVDVGAKRKIFIIYFMIWQMRIMAIIIIQTTFWRVVNNCSRVTIVMKEGRIVGEMEGEAISNQLFLRS